MQGPLVATGPSERTRAADGTGMPRFGRLPTRGRSGSGFWADYRIDSPHVKRERRMPSGDGADDRTDLIGGGRGESPHVELEGHET